jgi:glutamate synthase domain-containing protein 3
MSGGVAFVLDAKGDFKRHCNLEMVELESLDSDDVDQVRDLLRRHVRYTASTLAQKLLDRWKSTQPKFVKIMPKDYKRVLAAITKARQTGVPEDQAVMDAAHG